MASPASSTPRPLVAGGPLHDGLTREVAPDPVEGQAGSHLTVLVVELDELGPPNPLAVAIREDHGRAEGLGPLGLDAVHVRVARGDGERRAEAVHELDRGVVHVADTVEQQRPLRRPDEHHLLSDADLGLRPQSPEVGLDLVDDDASPLSRKASRVVHCCPSAGTHCLSSSQIAHVWGGLPLSAVSTPHVAQIQTMHTPWLTRRRGGRSISGPVDRSAPGQNRSSEQLLSQELFTRSGGPGSTEMRTGTMTDTMRA